MASYRVTSPDGTVYNVTPPDGASDADIMNFVQQQHGATQASQVPISPVIDPESGQVLAGDASPDTMHGSILNSPVGGFIRGVRDPIDALAQLGARGIEAIAPSGPIGDWATAQRQNVEDINRNAETDYEKNWRQGVPPSFDAGRLVGNVAVSAPLTADLIPAAGAGLLARLGGGMAAGGAAGALEPTQGGGDTFWTDKAKQVGLGTAMGAIPPAVSAAAGRVIAPASSDSVQQLLNIGVRPTPGQLMGGGANRLEQSMTSMPVIGDFIKSGRNQAVQQFNRGIIDNEVLAPIGGKLPSDTPLGHDAIAEAGNQISNAYDTLLPKLNVQADPQFASDISNLISMGQYMDPDKAAQFENILKGQVFAKMSPAGGMTGEGFKSVESEIGRLASSYRNSAIGSERQLGDALLQTQSTLREMLTRSNPQYAGELGNINQAYGALLRVRGAGARIGADEGVFSPPQLLSSVRQMDPTLRNRAFAEGTAPMQDIAEAGKSVLGNTVPDSGTPYRSLAMLLAGGAAGHGMGLSPTAAAGVAGLGAGMLGAYSNPGRNVLAHILAMRPASAPAIAQGLRSAAPFGSAFLGAGAGLGF